MHLDQRGVVEIGREQLRVLRLHAAVAAHVQVVALLRGDDAEVLALCLGALARAAGHGRLELVRRAQTAVAQLDADGHAHRVLHAVAAPGAAHARLHGAQRLAVGVARLEARVDQLAPDVGQLLDARAEQVDALTARDLGVEAVLLGHVTDRDQPVGRDLAARNARHHRVGAVLLDVGQEVVVRVLQVTRAWARGCARSRWRRRSTPPRACRSRSRGPCRACRCSSSKVLMLADLDQVEQLLARVVEVLAQRVGDRPGPWPAARP